VILLIDRHEHAQDVSQKMRAAFGDAVQECRLTQALLREIRVKIVQIVPFCDYPGHFSDSMECAGKSLRIIIQAFGQLVIPVYVDVESRDDDTGAITRIEWNDSPKSLIVAGGSAGWMAAAYINAALNRDGRTVAHVSLIESPDVPRIGVGEATIPNINHVLAVIGIDQHEFMRRVDGTFKQSIEIHQLAARQGRILPPSVQPLSTGADRPFRRTLADERSLYSILRDRFGAACRSSGV
jgi:hypothetical protein